MQAELTSETLQQFSDFVAGAMGLAFPPARWNDLHRGLSAAAAELGFDDPAECAHWLTSTPLDRRQLETLASNLTVGETYFFREPGTIAAFSGRILTDLINERRDTGRRIRIWSAACCTGEEPFTIAMMLHQAIPDLERWNVTVLATDINPRFLAKAAKAIYGPWSLRSTPESIRQRYFRQVSKDRFEVLPEIQRMVRFAHLNLVDDTYPSLANDTNAMDVIFCRNVLMYFTPAHSAKVIQKLSRAQMNNGWLIVGPCELSQVHLAPYSAVTFPDAILYRKGPPEPVAPAVADEPITLPSTPAATNANSLDAPSLYAQGLYAQATEKLQKAASTPKPDVASFSLLARSLANEGRLEEALTQCDRWIAAEKLNAAAYYLRAIVLQERGMLDEAVSSLRAALYQDATLVLAHFAMGNIARARGDAAQAQRHMANAARFSSRYRPDEVLPESEGMTAGRFTEIVRSLLHQEASP